MPLVKKSHAATDLLKALHGTQSSSNMRKNFPLIIFHEFFLCFSVENPFPPSFHVSKQSHFFVFGQLESLALPPLCGLVPFSAVKVEADGLIWPSLEIVDAVEPSVVMLPDVEPLIV